MSISSCCSGVAIINEVVAFFGTNFKGNANPEYFVKELDSSLLEYNGAAGVHPTTDGSSNFQVILFKPQNQDHLKAAKRTMVCTECQDEYGLSEIFTLCTIICH